MPPTQPLPDTPAPSHLFKTHNMGSDTQPTAPQMPSCENCGVLAQLQCGMCVELFFCDTPACYDACHPRPRDREAHRASVTSFGASSKCAHHPGQELCLVCEDPACGDALICMRCDKCDTHAGHKTVDITDYMKRQRDTLCSHVADLEAQRTAAEEKCHVLEALPPTEDRYKDRYKDLLLQTHVGHLVMREDVSRSEVVCEEELARSFLTQALSREGEVCALKTFVAKAGHMIAECEAVCQLGNDQVLRAFTESQAVVRNINSMAAPSGDRHRLVGAADPHAKFSLNLPVSNVHDALAQVSALFVPVFVQGLDGVEHEIEVSVDDTGRDLLRKVASAVRLREDGFDMTFRDEVIAKGEDVVQLRGHRVVVTQVNTQRKDDAIAELRALGETIFAEARLKQVTDPKVACLLLQAQVATAIPDYFFSSSAVTCIDLSHASAVTVIGNDFLRDCTALTKVELGGLQGVTSIGSNFLFGCTSLSTVDLSGFHAVTSIGNNFLFGCASLSTVDLSGLQAVTAVGQHFLHWCTALTTLQGKEKCSYVVFKTISLSLPRSLLN